MDIDGRTDVAYAMSVDSQGRVSIGGMVINDDGTGAALAVARLRP